VIRKTLAVMAFGAALLFAQTARAQDHVVGSADLNARLSAAETARQADRATVDRFLGSSEAQAAAAAVGADATRLRAGVATLADNELAELALRVDALQFDPVAGLDNDIRTLLVIFLIVAIVILVLQAVD
jgi:hypothetical protein